MFEYICSVCDDRYTTDKPLHSNRRRICFPCAMDELEADEVTCDDCEGTGKDEADRTCSICSGYGRV